MKLLTRLLLGLAWLAGIYSAIVAIAVTWPAGGWVALLLGVGLLGRRGVKAVTTLGSARFATLDEMKKAGMLSGKPGLIIGRVK